jgi:hypothetical protein
MKKSLLFLTVLILPFFMMAQEKSRQDEIGLVFSNLNNYGLTLK